MSIVHTSSVGIFCLQKKAKGKNNQDVILYKHIQYLKPFQIQGIRFLYNRYINSKGAILNDDKSLGKTVQCALFLSAVQICTSKPSLILCNSEKQLYWLYQFYKWTTTKAVLADKDSSNSHIVITTPTDHNLISSKEWNVIIIHDLDPHTHSKLIHNCKCTFKLWLTNKNIKDDIKELYKILQWISSNKIGTQKYFETTFTSDNKSILELWKTRQYLNLFCKKWLLRRTQRDVSGQLQFRKIDGVSDFEQWVKIYEKIAESNTVQQENASDLEVNTNKDSEHSDIEKDSPSILDGLFHRFNIKRKVTITDNLTYSKKFRSENGNENQFSCHPEQPNTSNKSDTAGCNSEYLSKLRKTQLTSSKNHDMDTTIESIIKKEESSGACLLDSLFCNRKLSNKPESTAPIKSEPQTVKFEHSDEVDFINKIDASERKTFKLLDRFFS